MNKILILLGFLLASSFLQAETIKADFKVEFGIIGEIGIANAILTKDDRVYEINVKLKATGIANTLSGGRKEHHISKGHIENGVMVSDYYQVTKSHGSKMTTKLYSINHEEKTVKKEYKRWKNGKLNVDETDTLDFYSADDLLTLYFNLNKKITDKRISKNYTFKAVGAEKQQGEVEVLIPKQLKIKDYKEMLGESDDSWYAKAIVHQDIFSSDKGELLLRIGNDGITQKAVLKDLIFFGDIRAERI
ncbi:MAG: Unknown protein [uncultured Sulfurovum sp.]|uniref:DUF3108 domain-containing protein n=1 Tax=uncultured Sulfurovum sp. TaxID=269237 RepID=A0A6S6TPY9_9BACT|nr:MAG: Unknown protein [uncultured Sulfurovum sp.]